MEAEAQRHGSGDPGGGEKAQRDVGPQPVRHAPEPILCRACDAQVSDRALLFAMDSDRIERVFSNPGGYLHDIVTVRDAWSLTSASPPSTEFSWYPGYAWEIVLCASCAAHLGWAFSATTDRQPARFYGLRRGGVVGV